MVEPEAKIKIATLSEINIPLKGGSVPYYWLLSRMNARSLIKIAITFQMLGRIKSGVN